MSDSLIEPVALAEFRTRKGFTRDALAEKLAINPRTLKGWEARQRRMGADDVATCARGLDLTDIEELALHRWAASVDPNSTATP